MDVWLAIFRELARCTTNQAFGNTASLPLRENREVIYITTGSETDIAYQSTIWQVAVNRVVTIARTGSRNIWKRCVPDGFVLVRELTFLVRWLIAENRFVLYSSCGIL